MRSVTQPPVVIELPAWADDFVAAAVTAPTDEARMRFVIELARRNVVARSGGPFGAAVFESGYAQPLAVGVNRVEALNNSCLHAEVVALMAAQVRVGSFTLRDDGISTRTLFTSCAPCAMCLGAVLWSGVGRLVCGATREDALALGFDEGPVFAESWSYVEDRGIEVVHGLLAAEARAVLAQYRAAGGLIYNR